MKTLVDSVLERELVERPRENKRHGVSKDHGVVNEPRRQSAALTERWIADDQQVC